MRFNTCRQCIRRRIQCDAAEPECQKCQKKGLSCSGAGKRYRFVHSEILAFEARKKMGKAFITPHNKRPETQLHGCDRNIHAPVAGQATAIASDSSNKALIRVWDRDVEAEIVSPTLLAATEHGHLNPEFRLQPMLIHNPCLQLLNPNLLMLFDHFSTTIAPAMVAIDDDSNGYRNIILPLATTDPLVKRAVSVVSALHLAKHRTDLLGPAERGRTVIIERLRRDAFSHQPDRILNISTWATIILLLVGETVTGDQEFIHLFPMLKSLLDVSANLTSLCPDATRFLWQQTQMFNLFTPPFLDPKTGVAALQQQLEQYLDFLSHPSSSTEVSTALEIIKTAIYLARDLYLKETRSELDLNDRWLAVERIKQLVHFVGQDTPGMHALVWTYFIAGAASSDHEHRDFFLRRLHQVYERTGMRNVLTTIDLLQNAVWRLPEHQNWSTSQAILNRVLIM